MAADQGRAALQALQAEIAEANARADANQAKFEAQVQLHAGDLQASAKLRERVQAAELERQANEVRGDGTHARTCVRVHVLLEGRCGNATTRSKRWGHRPLHVLTSVRVRDAVRGAA